MHRRIGIFGKSLCLFALCCALVVIRLGQPTSAYAHSLTYTPDLYQMHTDGSIWQYNGGGFHNWIQLDNNPKAKYIVARGSDLYQVHTDGSLWQYDGGGFHSWSRLDNNPNTIGVAAGGHGNVYELRKGGTIWQYNGASPQHWIEITIITPKPPGLWLVELESSISCTMMGPSGSTMVVASIVGPSSILTPKPLRL